MTQTVKELHKVHSKMWNATMENRKEYVDLNTGKLKKILLKAGNVQSVKAVMN